MMSFDNYLAGYLDRRMTLIIEDWQLTTKDELTDLTQRFHQVQADLAGLKTFETDTAAKLEDLEKRVKILKEKQK